jgi:putative hydrolase of the HAD superfamily
VAETDAEYQRLLDAIHPRVLDGSLDRTEARAWRFARLAEWLGERLDRAEVDALSVAASASYRRHRFPVAGAPELLRELGTDAAIGIVSNNLRRGQEEKLRTIGLRSRIDALVVSEAAGFAKPDPRLFEIAPRRIGVAAESAVMVGDSWELDILGARAAGIPAVWFDRSPGGRGTRPTTRVLRSFRPTERAARLIRSAPPSGT